MTTSKKKIQKRSPKKFFGDISTDMILYQDMKLSHPNDSDNLNQLHCFVRANLLEVFVMKTKTKQQQSKNENNNENVVGIRCSHCGSLTKRERGNEKMAVFFPKSIHDIYRGMFHNL